MKKWFGILTLFILNFSILTLQAQDWQPVGTGIEDTGFYNEAMITSLTLFQGHLYAGGEASGHCPTNDIAVLNGNKWDTVGGGITQDTAVGALLPYDSVLYVAGEFAKAGGVTALHIAQWNGTKWDSVGSGLGLDGDFVASLCMYNGELYAGLSYGAQIQGGYRVTGIAKWNGKYWDSVGTATSLVGEVLCMAVYNNKLYVGGALALNLYDYVELATWDGIKWDSVPGLRCTPHNIAFPVSNQVTGLQVYNGKLYVSGVFDSVAGMPVHHVAMWDGSRWDSVGGGTNKGDYERRDGMAIYHGNLITGGFFDTAGRKPANSVARWDGTQWTAMGNGLSSIYWGVVVPTLYVWGDTLYAGGDFTNSGGTQLHGVAKWHDNIYAGVHEICNNPPCVKKEVKVFPNPANTILNVQTEIQQGHTQNICIFNSLGKLVLCVQLTNSVTTIPVNDLAAGIYFYRVTDQNGNLIRADKQMLIH